MCGEVWHVRARCGTLRAHRLVDTLRPHRHRFHGHRADRLVDTVRPDRLEARSHLRDYSHYLIDYTLRPLTLEARSHLRDYSHALSHSYADLYKAS